MLPLPVHQVSRVTLARFLGISIAVLAFATIGSSPARAGSERDVSVGFTFGVYPVVPVYGWMAAYRPARYYLRAPRYAEVDIEIRPVKSRVFLDGKLIGIANDFDGYPGHLLLRPGRHVLGFSHPGRHSLSFKFNLRPGDMVKLDRTLPKLEEGEVDPGLPGFESAPDQEGAPETSPPQGEDPPVASPGILELSVSPPEARVNLDGAFFGTGEEIGKLQGRIPLSPGIHRVRVSRIGFESASEEVRISPAEVKILKIRLKEK